MEQFAFWLGGAVAQILVWIVQGASFALGVFLMVWMLS
jgi:hypothetical protein